MVSRGLCLDLVDSAVQDFDSVGNQRFDTDVLRVVLDHQLFETRPEVLFEELAAVVPVSAVTVEYSEEVELFLLELEFLHED